MSFALIKSMSLIYCNTYIERQSRLQTNLKSEIAEKNLKTFMQDKVEVNYLLQIIGIQSGWIKLSFCSSFLVACPQCYVIMKGEHLIANSSDSPQK